MHVKKVFLYAYDRQNLGDDLFVHTITKRYPEVKFYIWSGKENRRTFASLPNLKLVDSNSCFVRVLQKVRASLVPRFRGWLEARCDAVVYIGGSIFIEYPNWPQICAWWEHEAKNRPFYILGANFGPWHTEAYRQKMKAVFRKCRDVCFRDKYSHELFHDVETVRQAPDILLSYPMPQIPVKRKQIFVSVINCAQRDDLSAMDAQYVTNMAKLLGGYLQDGYDLVLASFCKEEGDEAGIGKILAAMDCGDHPRIRKLCYDGSNAAQMTASIAESEFVIATRFHAVILAMNAGRPVLPILYSDKTRHVLHDLEFQGTVFDLRDPAQWYPVDPETAPIAVDEAKQRAQEQFRMLDNCLLG